MAGQWRDVAHVAPHLAGHGTCHIIDLPSAGSSRYDATTPLSIGQHIERLHEDPGARNAAARLLRTFDMRLVEELRDVHGRLDVPVKLVWGDQDPFFPVERARAMVSDFPDASIEIIEGAGLVSHEEAPARVAEALLPTLVG